jgi:hypothetical protein
VPPRTYRLSSGEKVPGVTTVLGKFQDPDGLMWWAWNEGREGRDFHKTRGDAASAGTLLHALVEDDLKGTETATAEGLSKGVVDQAFRAYGAYQDWRAQTRLRITEAEVSLVSERFRYGGTFDAFGDRESVNVLADWKSSAKIQPKMVAQLGGYMGLREEWFPDRKVESGWILLFSREGLGFKAYHYNREQLLWGFQLFLQLRAAYHAEEKVREFYDIEAKEERE